MVFRDFIFFPNWLSTLASSWIPLSTVPASKLNHLWAPSLFRQQDIISHYEPLRLPLLLENQGVHHSPPGRATLRSVIGAFKTLSNFFPSRMAVVHKGVRWVGLSQSRASPWSSLLSIPQLPHMFRALASFKRGQKMSKTLWVRELNIIHRAEKKLN